MMSSSNSKSNDESIDTGISATEQFFLKKPYFLLKIRTLKITALTDQEVGLEGSVEADHSKQMHYVTRELKKFFAFIKV